MPKKNKEPMKELHLKFTGKVSMIIDLEEYGPLVYNINDIDVIHAVIRVILNSTNTSAPVTSYDLQEEKRFRKILESFE